MYSKSKHDMMAAYTYIQWANYSHSKLNYTLGHILLCSHHMEKKVGMGT
jgi:hypothetical protein